MRKAISISVPEDIHKLLETHKGAFNVSAVCQEALLRELRVCEALEKGQSKMTMTERLRVQTEDTKEEKQAEGRLAGIQWAQEHAEYDDLVLCQKLNTGKADLKDLEWVGISDDEVFDADKERRSEPFYTHYRQGFIEGAVEAFDEVADEVEAD